MFLSELNGLELFGGKIGDVCLTGFTKEKLAFVSGAEFGSFQRCFILIEKALYRLKSSSVTMHLFTKEFFKHFEQNCKILPYCRKAQSSRCVE